MTHKLPTVFLPGLLCDEAVWRAQMAAFAGRSDCRVADYGMLDSLASMAASVLESAPDEFLLVAHSMGGRVALEMPRLAQYRIKGLALLDTGSLLPRIPCPTLLLCGREDAWSPPARHEEMTRSIPGARLVIVDDCGHMSTMERPEAVNAALYELLEDCGPLNDAGSFQKEFR